VAEDTPRAASRVIVMDAPCSPVAEGGGRIPQPEGPGSESGARASEDRAGDGSSSTRGSGCPELSDASWSRSYDLRHPLRSLFRLGLAGALLRGPSRGVAARPGRSEAILAERRDKADSEPRHHGVPTARSGFSTAEIRPPEEFTDSSRRVPRGRLLSARRRRSLISARPGVPV
jgi:hypothetical protein